MSNTEREIIVIPASESLSLQGRRNRQMRVASYSRVSTDFEEQLTSFHAQKSYYTDLIMRTPQWTLAGTYADEGISGASAEKRPDFMKMIRHCKKGKIDLIITKSISRFARNTLDSIGYVRKLKAMGVGVIFEKENINTLEENSEVVLTILASLAQEELNSLSLNVKMGKRMAMQEGKVFFQYEKCYAYKKGADGQPEVIPEEAEIIKRIYTSYLAGESIGAIAKILYADGIKSHSKSGEWTESTLRGILQNERYCGDVLLQKTYVTDPISKKVKKNNGELPKILIKNNHPAIVSREIYDRAQQERSRRGSKRKVSKASVTEQSKYSAKYALSELLICGECLTPYKRTTWTKRNGEKQIVWRCISRLDYGTKYCKDSVTIDESSLHEAIMQAINATRGSRHEMIPYLTAQLTQTFRDNAKGDVDVDQIENRIAELKAQTMELVAQSIGNNTVGENEGRLRAMSDEIKALCDMLTEYRQSCNTENTIENRLAVITEILENEPEQSDIYNDTLVRQLIDTIKVMGEDRLEIIFECGLNYEQSIFPKVKKLNTAS
ncbi:recombinase family protein [Marasmitruncus massiliensis]|uniref:recombinase family protein n=1 Tax=Marasmitruncus massiliensis TaxID=1944642 RepID=UPI000C7BC46F|nr:recombinase family protein [Marasmitruncus massiliensis]